MLAETNEQNIDLYYSKSNSSGHMVRTQESESHMLPAPFLFLTNITSPSRKIPPRLSSLLVAMVAFAFSSCASVEPYSAQNLRRLNAPLFDSVSVSGLVFQDERYLGRIQANSTGSVFATAQDRYGSVSGSAFSSGSQQAAAYEGFDNHVLQESLKYSIEDANVAKRVVGSSHIRIEGILTKSAPSTNFGRILWNVVNTVTLVPMMLGAPYLGTYDSEVRLRVYANEELLKSYRGFGRAKWLQHGYDNTWFRGIKRQAFLLSAQIAIADAVDQIAATQPE